MCSIWWEPLHSNIQTLLLNQAVTVRANWWLKSVSQVAVKSLCTNTFLFFCNTILRMSKKHILPQPKLHITTVTMMLVQFWCPECLSILLIVQYGVWNTALHSYWMLAMVEEVMMWNVLLQVACSSSFLPDATSNFNTARAGDYCSHTIFYIVSRIVFCAVGCW